MTSPKKLTRLKEIATLVALSSPGVGGKTKQTFRLGAVLFDRKGRVLKAKVNSYKTNPRLSKYTEYPHVHAEQACILSYGLDNCEGLSLMVVRVRRDGSLADSKPCSVCKKMLDNCGLKSVWYSTKDGELTNDGSL